LTGGRATSLLPRRHGSMHKIRLLVSVALKIEWSAALSLKMRLGPRRRDPCFEQLAQSIRRKRRT
jgi:hypothetical protein